VQRQAQRTLHGSHRPRPALGFLTEGNQLEAGECCCRELGEHPEMRDARCERGWRLDTDKKGTMRISNNT
jgi:hypothetical protein